MTNTEIISDNTAAAPMSLDEARNLTNSIKANMHQLYRLVLEAHERKAWQALGYDSWRAYVTTEFDMSQSHAYRLLDQGRVIRAIEQVSNSPMGENVVNERTARKIKPQLAEVTQEIRTRIDHGEEPEAVVVDVVTTIVEPVEPEPESDETAESVDDADGEVVVDTTAVAPFGPPSNGRQFARIALMKLSEIRDDDLERQQAFDEVQRFLDSQFNRTNGDRSLQIVLRTLKALKTGWLSVSMLDNFATCMRVEARRFEELAQKRKHTNRLKLSEKRRAAYEAEMFRG